MQGTKGTLREDLYCNECGNKGMRVQVRKAESGRTRYRCTKCRFRTTKPLYAEPQILPKPKLGHIRKHKRFIITSAVNDTPVVQEALKTLIKMSEILNACLIIIPGVYKNPDLKHQGVINNYTWPDEILPYIVDADVDICPSLVVRGKTRIQYTAINPLSGMNHAGDSRSEIYGHPQVAMELVATANRESPKALRTTGTISTKNYGGSKQAQKAEFHHKIGAVFVETSGKKFWPTEVSFDGEGCYLYDKYYTPRGRTDADGTAGLVFGDTHVRFLTKRTLKALNQISDRLNPDQEVFHDLHDHHIGSHHSDNDVLFKMSKSRTRELFIRDELMMSVDFLEKRKNPVVVSSNHDDHLVKWFNRFKPQGGDVANLYLYYELAELSRTQENGDLFRLFIEQYLSNVRFTDRNKSFIIAGIDCSQHGDVGANGSRGSAKSFAKTGNKTIIGHSHTPRIEKGCYQVGTSCTDLPYAKGYSSWANAHCVIYRNGYRGMIFVIDGQIPPLLRLQK